MEILALTNNQTACATEIEDTRNNIFITGKPGVGKSVLINWLRTNGAKTYVVGAPTGLAALNAGGRTLHSLFGLPVSEGIIAPDYNRFNQPDSVIKFIRYQLQYLIIDEVSMVRADQFDYIDRLLRYVKDPSRPFGGVQVVIVGDFFQLPPVAKAQDIKALKEAGWESPFAFSAKSFETFKTLELSEVLRQKGDQGFIKLLHRMRTGDLTAKDMVLINDRVEPDFEDVRIRLVSTNKEAELTNLKELGKLPEEELVFNATQTGVWPVKDNFPAETELRLKIGAQVMVKMNKADVPEGVRADSDVVNGDLGLVEMFGKEDDESGSLWVGVRLRKNDEVVKIWRRRWVYKVKEKVGNEWSEREIASFSQIPLSLAWAISMHKSQGQSFEAVHIDCSRVFMPGQSYVAFSRCRSLEGITLESRVHQSKFFANKDVVRFFKSIEV